MDEVSRALPPYTWLTSMAQTSAVPAPPGSEPPAPAAAPGQRPAAPARSQVSARADTVPQRLTFRSIGNTVDIQALTRFMKHLEASPFIEERTADQLGDDASSRQAKSPSSSSTRPTRRPDPSDDPDRSRRAVGEVTMAPESRQREQNLLGIAALAVMAASAYWYFLDRPKAVELAETERARRARSRRRTSKREGRSGEGHRPEELRAQLAQYQAEPRRHAPAGADRATKCRRCSSRSRRPRAASGSTSPPSAAAGDPGRPVRHLSLQHRHRGRTTTISRRSSRTSAR